MTIHHKHENEFIEIMKTTKVRPTTHQIEGEFLEFIFKPGDEYKYIKVRVKERIIPIKLAKELRQPLGQKLLKGDRLSIYLEQKGLESGSKLKLKTDRVEILGDKNESLISESASVALASKPGKNQKGKILLCYKSSCAKRGGKQLYRALTETLKELGLQDRVKIELTGCQKQCKKAPSLTLMPGKAKYAYVNPNELIPLIKAHYLPKPE